MSMNSALSSNIGPWLSVYLIKFHFTKTVKEGGVWKHYKLPILLHIEQSNTFELAMQAFDAELGWWKV